MFKSIRHIKTSLVLEKGQSLRKICIDYSAIYIHIYIYKLQENDITFYCHPFNLPVKSNARSKFIKAFVSFFKEEIGNFLKLKLVFIQRCLVQFRVQIANLVSKSP